MFILDRDLKPGNILVAKDCQLRITDFGLARYMDDNTLAGNNRENPMTEYVVTRWYRCPELLLAPNRPYGAAVDMWSIGCILGELINRKPLFPGKSHAHQVQLVFELKGYKGPSDDFGFPLSTEAVSFLERRCRGPGQTLASFVPHAIPSALQLLEALLYTDPNKRPDAESALKFPYMSDAQTTCDYSKGTNLKKPDRSYFEFENQKVTLPQLCSLIRREVADSQGIPFDEFLVKNNITNEMNTPGTDAQSMGSISSRDAFAEGTDSGAGDATMPRHHSSTAESSTTPTTVRAAHGGNAHQDNQLVNSRKHVHPGVANSSNSQTAAAAAHTKAMVNNAAQHLPGVNAHDSGASTTAHANGILSNQQIGSRPSSHNTTNASKPSSGSNVARLPVVPK